MKALLIVDMQNDFMPEGPLATPGADKLIPKINALMRKFPLVLASKDWHPRDHESFATTWPVHCVQETEGSEFVSDLETERIEKVIYKGIDADIDSYSAFFDNAHRRSTGLEHYLHEKGIDELYLVGVATDYCVLYSTLDALELGFKVYVVTDGCAAIKNEKKALEKMKEKGAMLIESEEIA